MDIKDKQLLDAFSGINSDQETARDIIMNPDDIFTGFGIQLSEREAEAVRFAELEARCLMGFPAFDVSALIRDRDH